MLLLVPLLFSSCNQTPSNSEQNQVNSNNDEQPSQEQAAGDNEKMDELQSTEDYDIVEDSVMTSGNYIVFFMQNGEWANEIGAETLASDFSSAATAAIDSLKHKGFKASYLVGETIRIGLENGKTFRVTNPECVMGVVLLSSDKERAMHCGVAGATKFWTHFNEYYKPQL